MSFHYERLECESVNQTGGSNFFLLLRTIRMQKMCHSQHFFTWVVDFCYIEDCITFGRRCPSAASDLARNDVEDIINYHCKCTGDFNGVNCTVIVKLNYGVLCVLFSLSLKPCSGL